MDTPIFDELAARFQRIGVRPVEHERLGRAGADGSPGHRQATVPVTDGQPGTPANGGSDGWSDLSESAADSGWLGAACAWCGRPITANDRGSELGAIDPQTGDNITLNVCCAEHEEALMAHRSAG